MHWLSYSQERLNSKATTWARGTIVTFYQRTPSHKIQTATPRQLPANVPKRCAAAAAKPQHHALSSSAIQSQSVIALLHAKMKKNWLETKGLSIIERKDESSVEGVKVLASRQMRRIKPTARDSLYRPSMDTLDVIYVFSTATHEEFGWIGKR